MTVTDGDGHYTFPPLSDGNWTVAVEMFGFHAAEAGSQLFSTTKPVNFSLQLQESPMLQRMRQFAERANGAGGTGAAGGAGPAQADETRRPPARSDDSKSARGIAAPETGTTPSASTEGSDSLLVQGSLSQGLNPNAAPDTGPSFDQFGPGGNRMDASNGQQPGCRVPMAEVLAQAAVVDSAEAVAALAAVVAGSGEAVALAAGVGAGWQPGQRGQGRGQQQARARLAIGASRARSAASSHSASTTPSGMRSPFRSRARMFLSPLTRRAASA